MISLPVLQDRPSHVVYRGPSMLDGAPIVAIVVMHSRNTKTGDMCQLFILPERTTPNEAQRTGEDASVCGSCPQRPSLGGSCYVRTFQGPLSTWKANRAEPETLLECLGRLKGRTLRLGAYGDPAALPERIIRALYDGVSGHVTGYTHQWRNPLFWWLKSYVMASCDSPADLARAQSEGWRTFRVIRPTEAWALARFEIPCPAVGLGVECAQCQLCDGINRPNDRRKSIAILEH